MKILGIIPARYASTRLEGKPLLNIAGKSMIHRVYEQAKKAKSLSEVIVATDDQRIVDECLTHNINYILTSSDHINGTERCGEVMKKINMEFDVIVNIQGDEPFISPKSIDELVNIFLQNPTIEIGTLVKVLNTKVIDIKSYTSNPNFIKVVTDINNRALYFSRSLIPHVRDIDSMNEINKIEFKHHIGMYAFRSDILIEILKLKESSLEKIEKLEQLRWLENGYSIYVAETKYESKSVDTLEDYNYILNNLSSFTND